MTKHFHFSLTPQILQWLAIGQLGNKLHRALRLWVLINKLYGSQTNWASKLPTAFTYSQLRDNLFAGTHPKSDKLNTQEITAQCGDRHCICHQTFSEIAFGENSQPSIEQWEQSMVQLTGMTEEKFQQMLAQYPFATVHRSLRDDLKQLVKQGWLQSVGDGKYSCTVLEDLPSPPIQTDPKPATANSLSFLDLGQTWELLRVLESISFVQPNLSSVIEKLWEQITNSSSTTNLYTKDPQQRIFIHLDYILSPKMQDRVDNYQEQKEQLWRKHAGASQR